MDRYYVVWKELGFASSMRHHMQKFIDHVRIMLQAYIDRRERVCLIRKLYGNQIQGLHFSLPYNMIEFELAVLIGSKVTVNLRYFDKCHKGGKKDQWVINLGGSHKNIVEVCGQDEGVDEAKSELEEILHYFRGKKKDILAKYEASFPIYSIEDGTGFRCTVFIRIDISSYHKLVLEFFTTSTILADRVFTCRGGNKIWGNECLFEEVFRFARNGVFPIPQDDEFDVAAFWIQDDAIYVAYKTFAHVVLCKQEATNATMPELYMLWCLINEVEQQIAHPILLSFAPFITCIARHFGYNLAEMGLAALGKRALLNVPRFYIGATTDAPTWTPKAPRQRRGRLAGAEFPRRFFCPIFKNRGRFEGAERLGGRLARFLEQ
ncbi:hypothetical protein PHJA_001070500 [Phtheirospermum japonicum]|uniref:Uncharacterized protein n=1 Tax=Phtheirospermum japonicum TaxID=374723 RepID=A0A830BWD3_9LAMI|nr:hypothetical protein PHJA_001070500 [Phtheirospermum japonicum]